VRSLAFAVLLGCGSRPPAPASPPLPEKTTSPSEKTTSLSGVGSHSDGLKHRFEGEPSGATLRVPWDATPFRIPFVSVESRGFEGFDVRVSQKGYETRTIYVRNNGRDQLIDTTLKPVPERAYRCRDRLVAAVPESTVKVLASASPITLEIGSASLTFSPESGGDTSWSYRAENGYECYVIGSREYVVHHWRRRLGGVSVELSAGLGWDRRGAKELFRRARPAIEACLADR
jgi:hypothetical protein